MYLYNLYSYCICNMIYKYRYNNNYYVAHCSKPEYPIYLHHVSCICISISCTYLLYILFAFPLVFIGFYIIVIFIEMSRKGNSKANSIIMAGMVMRVSGILFIRLSLYYMCGRGTELHHDWAKNYYYFTSDIECQCT